MPRLARLTLRQPLAVSPAITPVPRPRFGPGTGPSLTLPHAALSPVPSIPKKSDVYRCAFFVYHQKKDMHTQKAWPCARDSSGRRATGPAVEPGRQGPAGDEVEAQAGGGRRAAGGGWQQAGGRSEGAAAGGRGRRRAAAGRRRAARKAEKASGRGRGRPRRGPAARWAACPRSARRPSGRAPRRLRPDRRNRRSAASRAGPAATAPHTDCRTAS